MNASEMSGFLSSLNNMHTRRLLIILLFDKVAGSCIVTLVIFLQMEMCIILEVSQPCESVCVGSMQGGTQIKKRNHGLIFLVGPMAKGLSTYVIRHHSK